MSRSLPLALTRILPEGRCRLPEQSGQGRTTVGSADSRTAHRALRSVFMDVVAFRTDQELSQARLRLLEYDGCTRGRDSSPRGRVVRLRGQPRDRLALLRGSRYRSMQAIMIETTAREQPVFRWPPADRPWQCLGLVAGWLLPLFRYRGVLVERKSPVGRLRPMLCMRAGHRAIRGCAARAARQPRRL